MPAHEHILTPDQIKILTAWVWGLSNKPDAQNPSQNPAQGQAAAAPAESGTAKQ